MTSTGSDTDGMPELCTIEMISEGHADRCPGESCAFWADGCALREVEETLSESPHVAEVLLQLRRTLEQGAPVPTAVAREQLVRALALDDDEVGPAGGATELV